MGPQADRAPSWSLPSPQSLVLRFALAAGLGVLADAGPDLRVLRVVPTGGGLAGTGSVK